MSGLVKLVIAAGVVVLLGVLSILGVVLFSSFAVVYEASCSDFSPLSVFTKFPTISLQTSSSGGIPFFDQFTGDDRTQREDNAKTIITTGESMGISTKGIEIGLAVAMDESNLYDRPYNLNGYNDADSVGVFQQRPSQGWGTPTQLMDVKYAAGEFFSHMQGIPASEIESDPMIKTAERIQIPSISAYEASWAKNNWANVAISIFTTFTKGSSLNSTTKTKVALTSNSICGSSGSTSNSSSVDSSSGTDTKSGWTSPLDPGYIQGDPFGERISPATHEPEFHEGTDLEDPTGKPIYAAHAGTIETARYSGDYGNFILINEGGGIESAYGHLSNYATGIENSPGKTVKEGQLIGYVGATGDATGPHLHFEIRINGSPIDPIPFMAKEGVTIK